MTRLDTEHFYRVDLSRGPLEITLPRPLMHQDAQADVFAAALRQDVTPVDLTGAAVHGYMTMPGALTTLFLNGEVVDNTACLTLPADCYARPGLFVLTMQVQRDDVRHTVLRVKGSIARTSSEHITSPDGTIPTVESLLTELEGLRSATAAATQAAADANAAAKAALDAVSDAGDAATPGLPTVYCWGDSLTEGVGGWLATPEMVQKAIVSAYPDVVSQTYPVVNLGCRGETIQTIMARQGADPMVVGGFTIPASSDEDVVVGYLRGNYYAEDRLGIATQSGDVAQPLKETEAGINPCTIGGVEGTLYRDMTADSEGKYAYRFRRSEDGTATEVPADTPIETFAMKHYRNGIAVIWMGANGAVNSHAAYIEKIQEMVAYGQYEDYIVLIAREYAAQWVLEDDNSIEKALTDENGVCHLLYLKPELLRRGYTLAGIAASAKVPDTSSWTSTTDEIKKQCPLLMHATGSSESDFETLHFSCYGYKAIGKLVVEKLGQLLGTDDASGDSGGTGTEPDLGYLVDGTDDFGSFAYKMTTPVISSGDPVSDLASLPFTPYDVAKNWTLLCRFADNITPTDGSLGSIFEMREYFSDAKRQTAVYLRKKISSEGTVDYEVAGGFGAFNFPFDNAPGYAASTDGSHYLGIVKDGDSYSFYLDGGLAYGAPLGYAVQAEHMSQDPIYLFGRKENGSVFNTVKGIIWGLRIYNEVMDADAIAAVLADM